MTTARMIFWDEDTQVDFISPSGRLHVPGSTQIVGNLRRLTEYARRHSIPIMASVCAHSENDPEFQIWPPHCVKGTAGQQHIPETAHPNAPVIGPQPDPEVVAKFQKAGEVVLEKVTYDVFTNPNADRLLDANPAAEIVIYGVATDFCVKATVLGLCDRGRRVTVVSDAIRAVDARQGAAAMEEFARRGVRFATTDEICQG